MSPRITLHLARGIVLCLLSPSCAEHPKAGLKDQKLIITGASTIAPLVSELGKRFEKMDIFSYNLDLGFNVLTATTYQHIQR
jgi:ABC-type phosphate transport system substrate-binding protein